MVIFHCFITFYRPNVRGNTQQNTQYMIILSCSPNQVNLSSFLSDFAPHTPRCILLWLHFWSDLISLRTHTHTSWKKLSWPLLSSGTVQLLSEDKTSWQLALFLSVLIWNASSWISFNILRQSIQAILSTTIIRMCVFLEEFLSPSAKIFAVRILFHSQFLFGMFPQKADYVLAVLQTELQQQEKNGQMGTLVVFFHCSFNYWTQATSPW